MLIINETVLECNKSFRVSFDGGDLSSDCGLLMLKEFFHRLGLRRNAFIQQIPGASVCIGIKKT